MKQAAQYQSLSRRSSLILPKPSPRLPHLLLLIYLPFRSKMPKLGPIYGFKPIYGASHEIESFIPSSHINLTGLTIFNCISLPAKVCLLACWREQHWLIEPSGGYSSVYTYTYSYWLKSSAFPQSGCRLSSAAWLMAPVLLPVIGPCSRFVPSQSMCLKLQTLNYHANGVLPSDLSS